MTIQTEVSKQLTASLSDKTAKWLMTSGIISIIIGVFALIGPFVFGLAMTVFMGVILTVFGITNTFHALKTQSQSGFGMSLLFGIISFFTGIFLWLDPMAGLITFGAFITIYFFISGVTRVVMAIEMRAVQGWGWALFSGLITTLLATMLLTQLPLSATWIPGVILGVDLIFFGLWQITFSKQVKKIDN